MTLRIGLALVALLAVACGPSEEDLAGREAAREALTALRADLNARDQAAREAMTLGGEPAGACDPAQVSLSQATFAEWNTEHLDRAHLASTDAIRERLGNATDLLDGEEPFRWANAARLIEEQRAAAESLSGHDVVMVAEMEPVALAADGTFTGGRTHGRIFGWDAAGQRVVCSADFEHAVRNELQVGAGTDLRAAQVYGARSAAFRAGGWGDHPGASFGVPSL